MSDMAIDSVSTSAEAKAAQRAAAAPPPRSVIDEETPEGRSFPKTVYYMVAAVIVVVVGVIIGYFITGGFGAGGSSAQGSPLGAVTPPPYGSNAIPQPTDPPTIPPHPGSNAVATPPPGQAGTGGFPLPHPSGPLPGPTVAGTFPPTTAIQHLGDPVDLSKVPGLDKNPPGVNDPSPLPDVTPAPPSVRGGAVALAAALAPTALATPSTGNDAGAATTPVPAITQPTNEAVYQHHTPGLPPSPYALRGGWEVAGAFTAALSSDTPGTVRGIVTQDVYASYAPPNQLPRCSWPAGTQLLGRYEGVKTSQYTRLYAVWTNVAFPNGHEITLPDLAVTDGSGANGIAGNVDRHTGRSIGTAILVTLLQAAITYGTQPRFVVNGQTMGPLPIVGQAASSALTPLAARAVEQSLDHVTISANPGDRVDLLIYPGIDLGESEC